MEFLTDRQPPRVRSRGALVLALFVALGAVLGSMGSCASMSTGTYDNHRWWAGLGPVLPHDTFPADCTLCHEGADWNTLVDDFTFDHEAQTGVPLSGAHTAAQCLRCHNDRGPVGDFAARGCAGCHEDVHTGQLGPNCTDCHTETNWRPFGQVELHDRLGFPLVGVHAVTQCQRCHPGAVVGRFQPTDNECLSCHTVDLLQAQNPNHIALGPPYTENCDRCHLPTTWNQAEVDF